MESEEDLNNMNAEWKKLLGCTVQGDRESFVWNLGAYDRNHGASTSRSGASASRRRAGRFRHCPSTSSRGPGPGTSSRGPSAASRGPSAASRGPSAASRRPSVASRGPSVASRGPSVASRGPSAASRGPSAASRGPFAASRGPFASSSGLSASSSGPSASSSGPSASSSGPSASSSGPSASSSGPSASNSGPYVSSYGPSTSSSAPSTSSYGASTSSYHGYSSSNEGFTFSYADISLTHGANTARRSNKTCAHVTSTPSDDEDNSPFQNGKIIHNAIIKCKMPNLKLKQTWTCSKSVAPYFEQLINIYKNKYFSYVYEHLEGSRLIVLINKELTKFFNNELKNKESRGVIRALHAIHSLSLNPLSMPKVITKVLARDYFLSALFDAKCHYNYGSFCFLTKEILADILSELFYKTRPKVWLRSFLSVLNDLCLECFGNDCKKTPTVCFDAIAAYLVIGIEGLPQQFYPSLKYYFIAMLSTISRNKLSSHCLEKVWDKLLLFHEHWVKYALCYPFLKCLDPSCSTTKFKDCKKPDLSIFDNVYMRNRLKYEYVHVEDGYVPCEYPSVPSFPKLPKSYPTLADMQKSHTFWSFLNTTDVIAGDLIGTGYCEECKESNCFCVDVYIQSEKLKKQQLLSELDMEVDGQKQKLLSESNMDIDNNKQQLLSESDMEVDGQKQQLLSESDMEVDGMKQKLLSDPDMGDDGKKQQLLSDSDMEIDQVAENVSSHEKNERLKTSEQQCCSDDTDEVMTPEEMSEYYDNLIKYNVRSYSFSVSQSKSVWDNIKIPDLTDAFTCTTSTLRERKKAASKRASGLSVSLDIKEVAIIV